MLRAVQCSLPQQFANTKQQILHWSPDMPCKVSEGCGTERTKIRQVLKQPHPFNILPFKNNLSLVTSITGELHQVEVDVLWGFGSFYPRLRELKHSLTPTRQWTRWREEKRAEGLISRRGCHSTTGGRTRGSLREEKLQKPNRRATRADNHQNRLSSRAAGGDGSTAASAWEKCRGSSASALRGRGEDAAVNHSPAERHERAQQGRRTRSLVLGRLRRAGSHPSWRLRGMRKADWQREGRGPLQGIPHLSWIQTNTATHNSEERRTESRILFVIRGRLRALNPARKGGWLHGTASISSSSGALFLYASLTGHREQLWHGSPGKPCHHLHTSTEVSFSLFYIHLLRGSETSKAAASQVRYPEPRAAFWRCILPACPAHPTRHPPLFAPKRPPQTCSLQPQHC